MTRLTGTIERTAVAGVLAERTGRRRDRAFHYVAYLDRLVAGTEGAPGA